MILMMMIPARVRIKPITPNTLSMVIVSGVPDDEVDSISGPTSGPRYVPGPDVVDEFVNMLSNS
jgi:hypothetical protein